MFCPNCGKNLDNNARFCNNCGYNIYNVNNNYDYSVNSNAIENKKNNKTVFIVLLGFIIVLVLVIILLLVTNNSNDYVFDSDVTDYCNESGDSSLCNEEETIVTNFEVLDFTEYNYSEESSYSAFYDTIVEILSDKEDAGDSYCNNQTYTEINDSIDEALGSKYSYLCGIDTVYINSLIERLYYFFDLNNLTESIVDAYVIGSASANEYANYTFSVIGSNSSYIAYIRRIHLSISKFQDYDKLNKTYERDLASGFHPKNSISEDIVVHETAHALDLYITALRLGISDLVIDDLSKFGDLYESWSNQSYSEEVVFKAAENANKNNGTNKTVDELRNEISGYAASSKNGVTMYAETFAEALVDYLANGEDASDLSIEIFKVVQEDLYSLLEES